MRNNDASPKKIIPGEDKSDCLQIGHVHVIILVSVSELQYHTMVIVSNTNLASALSIRIF